MNRPGDGPTPSVIAPGAALGVFGGGQLGRMFAHAAQRMGYRVHVFTDRQDSPAGHAAEHEVVAPFNDLERVEAFAERVDAVSLEFENVPTKALDAAARHARVHPSADVLSATQHRVLEKQFLQQAGAPVGPFVAVDSLDSLRSAVEEIGLPSVLKTARMGYDGKGQKVLKDQDDLEAAWSELGGGECILEAFVEFTREVSVLVARGLDGATAVYGPIENHHENHILDLSLFPAPETNPSIPVEAERIGRLVAQQLEAVGLICVELFETADGRLLVNEIAPRPHNSGHLTIEACRTSQFEQQVRALCGLPLGDACPLRPAAMANLLGDLWEGGEPDWNAALAHGVSLHLYGKKEAKRGRKMGHLTALGDTIEEAKQRVLGARTALKTLKT